MPTPVLVAGGALCLLGGYLAGVVLSPGPPDRATATVASFNTGTSQLCLKGDSVKDQKGLNSEGELCGDWRRTPGSRVPQKGESFRFVTVRTTGTSDGKPRHQTVIYGDVVE
jgi:hypothetical protein